jgi:hypothetical protein
MYRFQVPWINTNISRQFKFSVFRARRHLIPHPQRENLGKSTTPNNDVIQKIIIAIDFDLVLLSFPLHPAVLSLGMMGVFLDFNVWASREKTNYVMQQHAVWNHWEPRLFPPDIEFSVLKLSKDDDSPSWLIIKTWVYVVVIVSLILYNDSLGFGVHISNTNKLRGYSCCVKR